MSIHVTKTTIYPDGSITIAAESAVIVEGIEQRIKMPSRYFPAVRVKHLQGLTGDDFFAACKQEYEASHQRSVDARAAAKAGEQQEAQQ